MGDPTARWSDDVLKELASWLPVPSRARFEIVSKQCRQLAYTRLNSAHPKKLRMLRYKFPHLHNWVEFASKKPSLLANLRQLETTQPSPPQPPFVPNGISKCILLSTLHIHCAFESGPGIFAQLVEAKLPNLTDLKLMLQARGREREVDFWQRTPPESWEAFPKLQRLFINCGRASKDDLQAISQHLGQTLQYLFIITDDWSPLKSMLKLTELYVVTSEWRRDLDDLSHMAQSVAVQLAANPPGIGPHLNFANDTRQIYYEGKFRSIFSNILQHHDKERLLTQFASLGLDLAFSWSPYPNLDSSKSTFIHSCSHNTSYVDLARPSIVLKRVSFVRLLIELLLKQDGSIWRPGKYRMHSIFEDALLNIHPDRTWKWLEFASWLFGQPWADAIAKYPRNQLLGEDLRRPLVIRLRRRLNRAEFSERLTFVLYKPEIFGEHSPLEADAAGNTLMHLCHFENDVPFALGVGLDWRVRNSKGLNALDCLAKRCEVPATAAFLVRIPDADFVRYATKDIFGAIACRPYHTGQNGYRRHDVSTTVMNVLDRMFRLVDESKWKELVVHLMQTQFRLEEPGLIYDSLFGKEGVKVDPRLKEFALAALVEPYDQAYLKKYKNTLISALPVPHLLLCHGQEKLGELVAAVKQHLSPDKFVEWREALDVDGRDWRTLVGMQNPTVKLASVKAFQ